MKRDPRTNLRSARNNWDFWTSLPEALHQITITTSERGIPYSYRHMHGFGNHTFSFINARNERFWVKFHLHSQQGIKNLTDAEAGVLEGGDGRSGDSAERIAEREIGGGGDVDESEMCANWGVRETAQAF